MASFLPQGLATVTTNSIYTNSICQTEDQDENTKEEEMEADLQSAVVSAGVPFCFAMSVCRLGGTSGPSKGGGRAIGPWSGFGFP